MKLKYEKKFNIHNSLKSYLQTIFTKILVVKGGNKFQGTFIDRLGLSQEEGGGGTPDFKCQGGTIEGFFGGLKYSISGFCGVEKILKAKTKT